MATSETYPMQVTRRYSAHHKLFSLASSALSAAQQNEHVRPDQSLIAISLAAFAAEGLINQVGERFVPDFIKSLERKPALYKLEQTIKKLGKAFDRKVEPWLTLDWLFELRHELVHPKPQSIDRTVHLTEAELEKPIPDSPTSELEEKISFENAARAVWVVQQLKDFLFDAVPEDFRQDILGDSFKMTPVTVVTALSPAPAASPRPAGHQPDAPTAAPADPWVAR